jgi:antitoxin component HigA of HigAB toxin-antitoxin module
MYTNAEKVVKYLYQALGEQNFVNFVELLVKENLMSEIEFNHFKKIFEKKPEKPKSISNLRSFMN